MPNATAIMMTESTLPLSVERSEQAPRHVVEKFRDRPLRSRRRRFDAVLLEHFENASLLRILLELGGGYRARRLELRPFAGPHDIRDE